MIRPIFCVFSMTLLAACQPLTGASDRDAKAFFADNCAACHGAEGRGNGEMAAHLITPPPDLTTLSQRHSGTFPRVYVMSTIDGYHRGERFSAAMPEFGALDLGEAVMVEGDDGQAAPVPAMLLALTDYLESLQQ